MRDPRATSAVESVAAYVRYVLQAVIHGACLVDVLVVGIAFVGLFLQSSGCDGAATFECKFFLFLFYFFYKMRLSAFEEVYSCC